MNARQVMAWAKANIFIVIFAVVMIAALVALPLVASRMNESVRSNMQAKLATKRELEGFERTNVEVPGPDGTPVSESTTVNETLVNALRAYIEAERADADAIVEAAVAHNRKGREVLLDTLFPTPRGAFEVLPERFYRELEGAYDALLEEIGADTVPPVDELAAVLRRQERQFRQQRLQKAADASLTAEEQERLDEYLAEIRLGLYADAADRVSCYIDKATLNIPEYTYTTQMDVLFSWQWDFWLTQDILRAVARANQDAPSVRVAPVKRVLALTLDPITTVAAPSGGGGSSPRGAGGTQGGDALPAPPAMAPNESAELRADFGVSITGRSTNDLYDVRTATLTVIAETRRLPALFDAIAQENFMTVLDVDVRPADTWAAVRTGHYYGSAPVSEVTIQLESVWLRRWTREVMPYEVRSLLSVWAEDPNATPMPDPAG